MTTVHHVSHGPRTINPDEVRTSTNYTVEDQERMRHAHRYFAWQYALASTAIGNRVLEVGSGLGNFTAQLAEHEFVVSIDVEPECTKRLTERYRDRTNVVAAVQDISEPSARQLARYKVDSIVCLNVLEHIRDDRAALVNMAAILPAGGKVVLIVPAFELLYGPIDAALGHYRRYSKAGIRELASSLGYDAQVIRYMNVVGFFGWWFNSSIAKRPQQSSGQIAVFDSLVVPVMSRLERLIEPPCGQSLFVVLVKR